MARVKFTSALKRFFPELKEIQVKASTVREVVNQLEHHYPGLENYLVDDAGRLRQHVNIFVQEALVHDRVQLSDAVQPQDEIMIFQALSGG